MEKIRRTFALLLALALLSAGAARAEKWQPAEGNLQRFKRLFALLGDACTDPAGMDTAGAESVLEEIRRRDPGDYEIGRAVADHWYAAVLDPGYRRYVHRGREAWASELTAAGLDFGEKHAFVVLGYCLEDGEMAEELTGRCDAAAAAANSFPDSVLICTGGVTGTNNPEGHSEAGEMTKYLVRSCGIARERIYMEDEARSTAENAVNTLRIMKRLGIDTYTIVTSDYHQLWGQVLFNGVAAVYAQSTGYAPRLVGNYNHPTWQPFLPASGSRSGLTQLASLFSKGVSIEP